MTKTPGYASLDEAERDTRGKANGHGTSGDQQGTRFRLEPFHTIELGTEPEWLVDGILPARGLAVLYGEPGCGKSFVAEDLGLHGAQGQSWGGKRVEQGQVVYVTAEGATGFRKRLVAYRQHYDISDPIPFALISDVPDLGHRPGDAQQLILAIRSQVGEGVRVRAVVVDTLARTMCGADEITSADMGVFVANCDLIARALGCLVVVVHHAGKDVSRGARGSNALKAAADVEILVEGSHERRTATITKSKDGEDGLTLAFRLKRVEIEAPGREASSCVLEVLAGWGDKAATSRPRKLTGAKLAALTALKAALADGGQPMPASNQRPDKIGCPNTLWQRYAEKANVTNSDKPDSFRRTFERAAQDLQNLRIVGAWDGWAWLIE